MTGRIDRSSVASAQETFRAHDDCDLDVDVSRAVSIEASAFDELASEAMLRYAAGRWFQLTDVPGDLVRRASLRDAGLFLEGLNTGR